MTRSCLAVVFVAAAVAGVPRPAPVRAQGTLELAGRWILNRELSQFPREVGFGVDWVTAGGPGQGSTASGGRGRRGSGAGGAGTFTPSRESEDDSKRVRQLTAEVRDPSAHLTIAETPTAVTITNEQGQVRSFHPNGREDQLQLDGVPVGVTAKREAGRLVVLYSVEQGRDLRYTYSRTASPPQLVVEVQFIERGRGDGVRRVYEPDSGNRTLVAAAPATSSVTAKPGGGSAGAGAPALASGVPTQALNQQPDAELKGLTKLGVVVEDLSPQAAACGLNQRTIEAAVSKRLTDAGFTVLGRSDEDTYLYVNVITTSVSTGLCVSRYDAFLYSHATARLSYQEKPVLVQVSLLHKGGIAGGASAAHAEGVLRGVQESVDQFSTRIRDANKQ